MRPALAALAAQQQIIDEERAKVAHLLAKDAVKDRQIAQLTRGLAAVAKLTGLDAQVRTAIFKRADEQNPAQPIPEPAAVPPTQTTEDAENPEAKADVRAPGLVPGTNNDTAADAVTTTYTPGADIPSPTFRNLQDVTAPIDGTQGPRPIGETKTLVDVRVGDPMNAQVAFPVNGPFAGAQRTGSADNRAIAALRLAKLRIATSTAEDDDELVVMSSIVRDASLSDDAIARETATLEKVAKSASKNVEAPRNLVPRAASVQRTVPSLTSRTAAVDYDDNAEDLFLDL